MAAKNSTSSKGFGRKHPKTLAKERREMSDKTRWAYWMQAIEPRDKAIEEAFPDYHPLWIQESQRMSVSPKSFHHLRRHCLGLTRVKVAAYLRVSERTVQRWENGDGDIPFSAFEVLRLVFESTAYRLSHTRWDGWFFNKDGRLVSPEVGRLEVGPEDFTALIFLRGELDAHRATAARVMEEIAALQVENTRLRQAFRENAITNELEAMQERLGDLLASIQTAQVIPFPNRQPQAQEAAA